MSCKECKDFQASGFTSYYRWKHANIEVRACKKHLLEVFNALSKVKVTNLPQGK